MLLIAIILAFVPPCQTNDPSDVEMEQFWKGSAHIPSSVGDIIGRWSSSTGFGGSEIEFARDGTFIERSHSDVITRLSQFVEAMTGRYRWKKDTLIMSYTKCILKPTVPDSEFASISATIDDQMEWNTFLDGRCYFRQVDGRVFLIRESEKRFFSYTNCRWKRNTPGGKTVSDLYSTFHPLMKIEKSTTTTK